MFLSPAASLKKYKINGKELIIIGEAHTMDKPDKDKIKTWDFLNKKLDEGNIIHIEVSPEFRKNPKKHLDIKNAINIQMFFEGKKSFDNIEGVDYRRLQNFFGLFEQFRLQRAFFYMLFPQLAKIPIGALLKVIDNIMIFINKHFYGQMRNHINQLNKQYLDELYFLHKRIDGHTKFIKSRVRPNATFEETSTYYSNLGEFRKILEEYRAFVLKFMDLLIIMNILFNNNKTHTMLIGNHHAKNMFNMLKKYETTINKPNMNEISELTSDELKEFEDELFEDDSEEILEEGKILDYDELDDGDDFFDFDE